MNGDDNINDYMPSILNPRGVRKPNDFSLTQNSFVSRSSLSLRRNNGLKLKPKKRIHPVNKENSQNVQNLISDCIITKNVPKLKTTVNRDSLDVPKIKTTVDRDSLGFSAIEDLQSEVNHFDFCSFSVADAIPARTKLPDRTTPLVSVSSNTELDQNVDSKSETTVIYNVCDRPTISVSFGIDNCQSVDINSKKSAIKRVLFSHNDENTLVDCEIVEGSKASTESDLDENMNEVLTPNSLKRSAVTVNLEIKKKKPSSTVTAENKVLILNTSAIEKISHVIVQPPNYKLVKGKILDKTKFKSGSKRNSVLGLNINNGKVCDSLRQKSIDSFFPKRTNVLNLKVSEGRSLADPVSDVKAPVNKNGDEEVMSRNSGVADAIKNERSRKSPYKGNRVDNEMSNRSTRVPSPKERKDGSPRPEVKTSCSSPRGKVESLSSHSPRKTVESINFSLPPKSVSTKRSISTRSIPHHKIVAGTHFAVDAFSYGEIPNVKHYFLTHFHSDHYSGLKKGFNKLLFCSKITADLCVSRLGVSPKCIHLIKIDETIRIDGVEVTAVEANHCPGAIMLVFTLPSGKTLLHTGDFRASPAMESYPVFWNKDIHTIYLDTTYCNPRYDFPTQEQSLEMALYILRQKKVALEKVGKKFSSVLIVCGTYTIGKEKFFLGMSRRVGCTVWACPEKDRVLQAVEGRSFGHAPPHACQLHVVPMRDLTHSKLRSYLDSLKGAFTEIVAFKPSGWENGKSASVERDMVTIHGIPYSEHSSFSELVRFVKFLKPKQVVPTVDISGGVRAVQKYFPCPLVHKEEIQCQSKVTDFFSIQNQQQVPAVT